MYDPKSDKPFKISRSKLELFMNCPRCFYIDRRLGVAQPPGYPFTLNSAVDALLKKEFDEYREKQKPHPLMVKNKINAVPFKHDRLEEWRDSLHHGIQYCDEKKNLIITGGVDDIWVNPDGELIVVDYKATSKKDAVSLDADWQISYKRQMSLYAWLFKMNGFKVHGTGYFVYANGLTDKPGFNHRLEFDISVLPYKIDDSFVAEAIARAYECLNSETAPEHGAECDYCAYFLALKKVG